jgi:type I restriction enzyme S subunit
MKSNYKALYELVERIDERNSDGSVTDLLGVSIDKCFIKSVANTNGTDLTKYKVIRKDDFAVSLMQVSRDSKIPVARLDEYDKAIMSPAYPIFRVKDKKVILPEYLDMWFKRPEFDREAAFIAVGGVRGSMPWEEFEKMQLPVPPIEEQLEIVASYKAITDRIALKRRINDNLEATAQAVYKKMFVTDVDNTALPEGWRIVPLESISELSAGGDKPSAYSDIQSETCNVPIFSNGIEQEGLYGFTDKAKISDESVTVSARGTVGYVFLREEPYVPIVRLIAVVPDTQFVTAKYLYFALSSIDLHSTGTSQQQITVPDFKKRQILIPDKTSLDSFMEKVVPIFDSIRENKAEIKSLAALQSNFLTLLSR